MTKPIKKSDPRAAFRRVYFEAVSLADMKTKLADASLGTWGVMLSKNGAVAAAPSGGATVTEVDSGDQLGVWYVQLAAADVDTIGSLVVYVTNTDGATVMASRGIEVDIEQAHLFTVTSSTTTAIVCDHAVSTANFWQNALVVPLSGDGVGQVAKVATSASGLLGLDTDAGLALALANGDVIELVVR